jgi:hypothetical protein
MLKQLSKKRAKVVIESPEVEKELADAELEAELKYK